MKISLTGSLGNISKPLSKALGAVAAIGTVKDQNFLRRTFAGADLVYLMEPAAPNRLFDKSFNPYDYIKEVMTTYKSAVEQVGVQKVVHLSSIGAHKDHGVGLLR